MICSIAARRTEEETQATETGVNNSNTCSYYLFVCFELVLSWDKIFFSDCRTVELLPLKSPDCRYEQRKVLDSNGCPMPPTIVCTSEENGLNNKPGEIKTNKILDFVFRLPSDFLACYKFVM